MRIKYLLIAIASVLTVGATIHETKLVANTGEQNVLAKADDGVTTITLTQNSGDTNWFPAGDVAWVHSDVEIPGETNVCYKPADGFNNYRSGYFKVDNEDWYVENDLNDFIYFRKLDSNKFSFDVNNLLCVLGDKGTGSWDHKFIEFGGLYVSEDGDYININEIIWRYKKAESISFIDVPSVKAYKGSGGIYFKPSSMTSGAESVFAWGNHFTPIANCSYLKKDNIEYAGNVELINNGGTYLITICRDYEGKCDVTSTGWTFGGFFYYADSNYYVKLEDCTISVDSSKNAWVINDMGTLTGAGVDYFVSEDTAWLGVTLDSSNKRLSGETKLTYYYGSGDSKILANGNNRPNSAIGFTADSSKVTVISYVGKDSEGNPNFDGCNNILFTVEGTFEDSSYNKWIIERSSFYRTSTGWTVIGDLNASMSLGYRYSVDGEGTIVNDDFRLRVAADETIASNSNFTYGLEVRAQGKSVEFDSTYLHHDETEGKYYTTIGLGAIVTNDRLDVEFEVKGWMKCGSGYGYTSSKTYSVREMIEYYYNMPAYTSIVAHLYNYINSGE